jgi:hypothetical protein
MFDESTDFHAGEIDLTYNSFGYAAYFENIRHTLNTILKKPIQTLFSNNGVEKLIIQCNRTLN